MPEKETLRRAREDARQGKAPTTQAGEFVREEIEHVRQGKHGVRSPKQAIAIGLSKARRAGVELPPPPKGTASAKKQGSSSTRKRGRPSLTRSKATTRALKREGTSGASRSALSKQAKNAASRRRRAKSTRSPSLSRARR
jgi:hypothetical protein